LGLIDKKPLVSKKVKDGDCLIIIGKTKDELGGSEYYEYIHKFVGGNCPKVDFAESKRNMKTVLDVIKNNIIKTAHDCSKGGLAVAVSEICMTNQIGCEISLDKVPGETLDPDRVMFSESHSRYLLVLEKEKLKELETILVKNQTSYMMIGGFGGKQIQFSNRKKSIVNLSVDKAQKTWFNSLRELVMHG